MATCRDKYFELFPDALSPVLLGTKFVPAFTAYIPICQIAKAGPMNTNALDVGTVRFPKKRRKT